MRKIPATYQIIAVAVLVILALVFILGRVSAKDGEKSDTREDKDARKAVEDEAKARGMQVDAGRIQRDARGLETAFGFNWGWWGIDAWTEDEDTVVAIVLLYNSETYPLLEVAYYELLGKNLTADIHTYVDAENLDKIRHILP